MTDLYIHPLSTQQLKSYVTRPTQSLLLSGPVGIGTLTIAQDLARQLRTRPDDIHLITPDEKGTIAIERIRSIYQLTRSIYDSPRVIIIDDSDCMSAAAQNALLKLLEEPTKYTYFILTTHQPQLLLQTILSRVQVIPLRLLSTEASKAVLANAGVSSDDVSKLLFIAAGLPAELNRLSQDPEYFRAQSELVTSARTLIQASPYERLVALKNIKDRTTALSLVLMIGRLLEFTILRNKRTDLASSLEIVDTVATRLQANGNAKIQLTYLMSKLP